MSGMETVETAKEGHGNAGQCGKLMTLIEGGEESNQVMFN